MIMSAFVSFHCLLNDSNIFMLPPLLSVSKVAAKQIFTVTGPITAQLRPPPPPVPQHLIADDNCRQKHDFVDPDHCLMQSRCFSKKMMK